ncbi:MAG: TlpA family protein disulfide reductase [Candidatus Latescibacterota bacterium]|nr:MAG: TlpA family protein disulfide reductase [Candidatus Latescibacterota bacterium]
MRQRVAVRLCALLLSLSFHGEALGQVGAGDPAPDFTLLDVQGTPLTLSSFRGKVVLLGLIGYACAPCVQAAPSVEQIWRDFSGTGAFQTLALDMWNGTVSLVQSFIDQTGVTFPVLRDAGFLQGSSFYGIQFDNYVVIDPTGVIRYTSVDEASGSFNDAAIRAAIAASLPVAVQSTTWSGIKELYR